MGKPVKRCVNLAAARIAGTASAVILVCAVAGPVQAGVLTDLARDSTIRVTLENLDKDIDDVGLAVGPVSNAGAVLEYNSTALSGRQLAFDPYIRYEDSFGTNSGSYQIVVDRVGGATGLSYASDTVVSAAGTRSPMVSALATVTDSFRVDQETRARLNVTMHGNTNAGRDFVGLQLDGTGDAGGFQRAFYAPSTFGLGSVNASASKEITLLPGYTYLLEGSSRGSTLYSAAHDGSAPPSSLAFSLLTTQSLVGNSQTNALKPNVSAAASVDGSGFAHQFLLDSDDLGDGTVWLDPDVAVGFDYRVDGASVLGIDLLDISLFNNPDYDLYDLSGNLLANLMAGTSYDFLNPVNGFSLRGIDPALALDPLAPGFTLGLRFDTPNLNTVLVTQSPLTQSVTSAVPAPNAGSLMALGLIALVARRRRISRLMFSAPT